MKNLSLVLFIIISGITTSKVFAQQSDYVKEYLERLEHSKKYILLVAKLMPEENYNFRATEGSMSFAENLLHIGYAADWHSQSLLGGREARDWNTDTIFKVADKSKKEMIATVNKSLDDAITLIKKFDITQLQDKLDYFGLQRTKRQIFMLLVDHITHHRGQMLVFLRLNGILPPRYVLFQ